MKKWLLMLLLFMSLQGQAQWIWKNDSLKRSDVIQLSVGMSYGTFEASTTEKSIKQSKTTGWERGFNVQLHAKLSPALSIVFAWKKLEQGIMMYYRNTDFYESYYLQSTRKSVSAAIAFTARTKKKKELLSLWAGANINRVDFSVPFEPNFNLLSPYSINNTGSFILDALPYSNHSYLMGLSKGIPLGAGFSLNTFAEAEYTPEFATLDYTYYDKTKSPVVKKTVLFTFSSLQTRLGVNVKW